jgi:hypothetical protein
MVMLLRGSLSGLAHHVGLLALCAVLAAGNAAAAPADQCPVIGAIRWDAWFGAKGVPGMAVERSLGPSRWHDRLPTCAEVVAPDAVRMACDSVDQMVIEIDQATAAGIDFWAFVTYPDGDPMSLGLRTYLRAPNRNKLSFALITEFDKWGDRTSYREPMTRFTRLLREPGYLRVAGGRPLLFLGFVSEAAIESRFGSRAAFRSVLDEFRSRVREAGLPDPYMVLMEGDVQRASGLLRDLGFDAVSAYAVSDNAVRAGSYAQLAQLAEGFWSRAAASRLALVPLVMSGWDRRPRVLNPVPWERGRYSEEQLQRYFAAPAAGELQAHVSAALRRARSDDVPSRAVLVYAWNEFDEGGWLAPTRGEGTKRLDAIRQAELAVCPVSVPR